MKIPAIVSLAAAIAMGACGTAAAGGARIPHAPHAGYTVTSPGGANASPQPSAPAGMPNFYQPSYSIETKEWWLPHPYFQSNGQGFGYPTRPVARPYYGNGNQGRW